MKLKERLKQPTLHAYVDTFNQLLGLDLITYYIIRLVNYNLFIFILGILASLAINILTSLISYRVTNNAFFILFLTSDLLSLVVTFFFAKFTLRFIEIQDYCKQSAVQFAQTPDDIEEGMTNRTIEKFIENRSYLNQNIMLSFVFFVLLLVIMFLCFLSANVFCL